MLDGACQEVRYLRNLNCLIGKCREAVRSLALSVKIESPNSSRLRSLASNLWRILKRLHELNFCPRTPISSTAVAETIWKLSRARLTTKWRTIWVSLSVRKLRCIWANSESGAASVRRISVANARQNHTILERHVINLKRWRRQGSADTVLKSLLKLLHQWNQPLKMYVELQPVWDRWVGPARRCSDVAIAAVVSKMSRSACPA